jgi:hypothetical protein
MESLAEGGSVFSSAKDYYAKNRKRTLIIAAIVVMLIIMFIVLMVWSPWSEGMTPFYLDQIAMQHSDPTYLKFAGRDRDSLGMSMRDYYLEHDMNSNNEIEPMTFTDSDFTNTTDYLQMPRWYRPKTLAAMVRQPGNVSVSDDSEDTSVADDRKRLARLQRRAENPDSMNRRNRSGRERFLH